MKQKGEIHSRRGAKRIHRADGGDVSRFLRSQLVHVRDLPNGYDFIFKGTSQELQRHLERFIKLESSRTHDLNIDHARIEGTILMRVTGPPGVAAQVKSDLGLRR